jgi:nicotinate-nucleotide adenylyltransferase
MIKPDLSRADLGGAVALYGGAFDPFHLGHVSVIRHLRIVLGFSTVLIVPSGDRPDKEASSLAHDRIAMTRLGVQECFRDDEDILISDAHISGELGYGTIDLIRFFQPLYTKQLYVIIGSELVQDLPSWKEPSALQKEARFLVIPRPGNERIECLDVGWNISIAEPLNKDGMFISSTEVRAMCSSSQEISGVVPRSVADYIRRHKLYR